MYLYTYLPDRTISSVRILSIIHQFIYPSILPSHCLYPFIHLSNHSSIHLPNYPSIQSCIHPFICTIIYLSIVIIIVTVMIIIVITVIIVKVTTIITAILILSQGTRSRYPYGAPMGPRPRVSAHSQWPKSGCQLSRSMGHRAT